jgi:multiple sugar transport system permease protein
MTRRTTRTLVRRCALFLVAAAITVVLLFPIYWIASLSLQDAITSSTFPPQFIFTPTLRNYRNLFVDANFAPILANTALIALGTTLAALALGIPAAYALARFKFGSGEKISFLVLSVRIIPSYVAVVPLFMLLNRFGLYGSRIGVILAISVVAVSFATWMMRAFILAIPQELEDAAQIDGCTRLEAVVRVVLPLAAPGLVATGLFTAILGWNDFVFVLILGGEGAKTMPVALSGLVTEQRVEWGQLAAGGVLTMLPVIVFALLVRRYFLTGVVSGGVNE